MKITAKWLREKYACREGMAWWRRNGCEDPRDLLDTLIDSDHEDWARWLVSQMLTHSQRVVWVIEGAEAVLPIYEDECPDDNRPRKTIQTAKDGLAGRATIDQVRAAADDATDAADAAYAAYAVYAAEAASAATYCAYASAYAADATDAACVIHAADAAYSAYAACVAAGSGTYVKLLKRGLEIALGGQQQ